ncbi:MAG: TMEM175 family protein [Pseudomonadota bacterium]
MSDPTPSGESEGRPGVGRVEAFSDGVIAIIVTIMVLELHPPVSEGMDKLWTLWPVFLAYVLSYAYVAIYWVNHHRLFTHATHVTNGLIWSNMALLFALSLVPFSTSYLGEHHFNRDATLLYLATMLLPSLAYVSLQTIIRRTGKQGPASTAYHRQTTRKGIFASFVYASGIPLSFLSPWLGVACAALVAIFWFLPKSGLDNLFDGRAGHEAG